MNTLQRFLRGGLFVSMAFITGVQADSALDRLTDNGLAYRTADQAAKVDDKLWQAREDLVEAYCQSLIGSASVDSPVAVLDPLRQELNKQIDELRDTLIKENAAPKRAIEAACYYVYSVDAFKKLLQKYQ